MNFLCNSCEGTYSDITRDGSAYYHACPPDVLQAAVLDILGAVVTPQKLVTRENIRNENLRGDVIEQGGKFFVQKGSTQDESGPQLVEVTSNLIAEGLGRTLVE